jgi:hypothetical protein
MYFAERVGIVAFSLAITSCGNGTVTAPWIGTKQLGVAGAYTQGGSIFIDASGSVFVAGFTSDGLDGNTLARTYD